MMIRTVAIYVRLSLEDDDLFHGKMESESITNQRDLLTAYIRNSNGEWTNIQDMTARELRFAHNIPKLYIAGEFKKMPY